MGAQAAKPLGVPALLSSRTARMGLTRPRAPLGTSELEPAGRWRSSVFPTTLLLPPHQVGEGYFPTCPQGNWAPDGGADSPSLPTGPLPRSWLLPGMCLRVKGRHSGVMQSWVGQATSAMHLGPGGPLPAGSAQPLEKADIKALEERPPA